jgi:signal transduction histidine kinase
VADPPTVGRRSLGLQGRLLAGLAVLVLVAIASAGWLTLRVAAGGLDEAEEARARGMGAAVASLVGRAYEGGGDGAARAADAARSLLGLGGITEIVVVDAAGRPIVGQPGDDGGLAAAASGGTSFSRRTDDVLTVYAPIRAADGHRAGAVRLRVAVGANINDAVAGSTRLLAVLTAIDLGLILLFGALFVRGVVRPLAALSQAARRVAEGDLTAPALPAGTGEVGALADSFGRMIAALREQREKLAASREQVLAQEKLATVGKLAAGVAHEIGNPLTSILGYVELLAADVKDPAARELLDRVRNETTRIHRIVHDLLDYARPVADQVEPVRLAEVVDAALDLVKPQPRFREVTVTRHIDGELPDAAASSPRLLQVVLNLLLNAADSMSGKGEIAIAARSDEKTVSLEIADTGPGVPEADRGKIFDPFFTTKEPGAGTGLGLAVCRSIVATYGGEITLLPSEKGATFRVTLPKYDPKMARSGGRSP